jgi:hypothetical protein
MPEPLGIQVQLLYSDDEVRMVVPQQKGLSFEAALPKLRELAQILTVELELPVVIDGDPERHTHPEQGVGERVSKAARQHAH